MNKGNAVEGQIQGGLSECQICAHLILGTSCNHAGWSHAVNPFSASCGGAHAGSRPLVGSLAIGRQHQLEEHHLIMRVALKAKKFTLLWQSQ